MMPRSFQIFLRQRRTRTWPSAKGKSASKQFGTESVRWVSTPLEVKIESRVICSLVLGGASTRSDIRSQTRVDWPRLNRHIFHSILVSGIAIPSLQGCPIRIGCPVRKMNYHIKPYKVRDVYPHVTS